MNLKLTVVFTLAAILLAACSGGGSKPATPGTGTALASPGTATPTLPSTSPSPGATGTTEAAAGIDWTHRLAVYTAQLRVEQGPDRMFPRRAVVTWDLDAGKLAASFEYTAVGEYPIGAAIAGRDIVFATEARVVRAHLDGTDQQVLLKAGEGNVIQDIRVSPDARLLAIVGSPVNGSGPGDLHVLDVRTGTERLQVRQADLRFAGMRGHFGQVRWRDDANGVLVSMATHSEMYGSLVTIFLDGHVRLEDVQGYGNVSPTGTMRAGDVGEVGCMFVGSHEFVIRDLDSGQVPLRAKSESTVYSPWEWSPDGSQFVFLQQEASGCDDLASDKGVAYVVRMEGNSFGAPVRVSDLAELHRQWYGDRLFSTDCDAGNEPMVDRWGDPRLYCIDSGAGPDAARTLKVGDRPAGTAVAPQPVGVIEPGAGLSFARVKTGTDCLNVRENPAQASLPLGCFKDGVVLRLRPQPEQTADGVTWIAVETLGGRMGWASAEFLEP